VPHPHDPVRGVQDVVSVPIGVHPASHHAARRVAERDDLTRAVGYPQSIARLYGPRPSESVWLKLAICVLLGSADFQAAARFRFREMSRGGRPLLARCWLIWIATFVSSPSRPSVEVEQLVNAVAVCHEVALTPKAITVAIPRLPTPARTSRRTMLPRKQRCAAFGHPRQPSDYSEPCFSLLTEFLQTFYCVAASRLRKDTIHGRGAECGRPTGRAANDIR